MKDKNGARHKLRTLLAQVTKSMGLHPDMKYKISRKGVPYITITLNYNVCYFKYTGTYRFFCQGKKIQDTKQEEEAIKICLEMLQS